MELPEITTNLKQWEVQSKLNEQLLEFIKLNYKLCEKLEKRIEKLENK